MFVRVKSTPNSPRKSVQIVKSIRRGGKVSQKIVSHVGIAFDDEELEQLKSMAESIKLKLEQGDQPLLVTEDEYKRLQDREKTSSKAYSDEDYHVDLRDLIEEDRVISGIHDIYGKLFDELNLGSIFKSSNRNKGAVNSFRNMVLARIAAPSSKRASVNFLETEVDNFRFGIRINLDSVYRMMDKIDDASIEKLNKLAYNQTLTLFEQKLDVIFFDCTTLYFESFSEDEFRKCGYSKDLKFSQPQVLIALMVTKEGLPIGYEAFSGDTYEGKTLAPALEKLKKQYKLDKVVYVADAGLLSKENLEKFEEDDCSYEYIVGARLKNLPKALKDKIINHGNYKEVTEGFRIADFDHNGRKLIVSYSQKRANKDRHDREKAILKLTSKLGKIKNPKEFLSNHGSKKYLQISCDSKVKIELNKEKIKADEKWDGLHGVITNSQEISNDEVLAQYKNLWQVEESFRVTKHDLRIRPIYHFKEARVKAHLAISFAAYTLVRNLEYRVKLKYVKLSPEKIKNILLNVQNSILYDSKKKIRFSLPSQLSQDAKKIYKLMDVHRKAVPFILAKR
jgi:transposase